MSSGKQQQLLESLIKSNKVLHEAIIDLYLQVKIRSNDEIDQFSDNQFGKERDRLRKFDSLTILDYIRTSIEILMQMKLEEERGETGSESRRLQRQRSSLSHTQSSFVKIQEQTPMSSTTKSIDLPPKEYETQLQLYEAEVRNHIKVEQQLKLHIEVLQEKTDDIEKEKSLLEQSFEKQRKIIEKEIKSQTEALINEKQEEINKLSRDMEQLQAKLYAAQSQILEKQKSSTTQYNNANGGSIGISNGVQGIQINASSIHAARTSNSKSKSPENNSTMILKSQKQLKANLQGKSPYLNDSFYKLMTGTQTTTGSNGQGSNNSSAKSQQKKNFAVNSQDSSANQECSMISVKQVASSNKSSLNNIQDNMKVIAAIQRMRMGNANNMNGVQESLGQSHKKNKSFTHYGTNGQGKLTSKQQQQFQTNRDAMGDWVQDLADTTQINMNSSFSNESSKLANKLLLQNQFKGQSMQITNSKKIKPSKIAIVDQQQSSLNNVTSITTHQKGVAVSRQIQNQDPNQILFKKVLGNDIEIYQRRKQKTKSVTRARDDSSQSGRGSSQGNTQQNINLNSNQNAANHHRVYSIDMIEQSVNNNIMPSQQHGNNQDAGSVHLKSNNNSSNFQIKALLDPQGTNKKNSNPSRSRPRSQFGQYNQ